MPIRVLICDDHPMCREAFALAVAMASPDAEVDRAESLEETEQKIRRGQRYDFVLTDLLLPDSDGFVSLLVLAQSLPQARIAVTTGAVTPAVVARARALGAVGFIPKSTPISELIDIFGRLLGGEMYFPEAMEVSTGEDDPAERLRDLTPSQLRIVLAAARGQLNKQIAYDNGLTEATVKAHLAAAFKKLGVTNRVQAGLLVQSLAIEKPSIHR